ncbi:LytTR family transcriptional regulator DNA-binding domain-containing protein [Paenibacillus sp. A3]|uniref:LytTR family transcriptional regulator DNA-binding domain-containing protein n=1 Tax=Paenibacillus sp. A3 TaxID=1337054 RepID=UPI0009EC62A3
MTMNLPLPCINKNKDKVSVFIEEVVLFTVQKNDLLVHTVTEKYILRLQGSLDAFEVIFSPFGFSKLDSGNLVHLAKIKYIDEKLRTAHFDNNLQVNISMPNMHKVKHLPRKTKKTRVDHAI